MREREGESEKEQYWSVGRSHGEDRKKRESKRVLFSKGKKWLHSTPPSPPLCIFHLCLSLLLFTRSLSLSFCVGSSVKLSCLPLSLPLFLLLTLVFFLCIARFLPWIYFLSPHLPLFLLLHAVLSFFLILSFIIVPFSSLSYSIFLPLFFCIFFWLIFLFFFYVCLQNLFVFYFICSSLMISSSIS